VQGLIEVLDGGIGNTIQDLGRTGFRHMGIAVSGCLDAYLARCANALVGNPADSANCACIEIRAVGPRLAVREGPVRLALAGALSATLFRNDGETREIAAWRSVTLHPGDELEFEYLSGGSAYLAVYGGIVSPLQFGSRSTYSRALIGGIDGKPLTTGNLLPCSAVESEFREYEVSVAWTYDADAPMRVIQGPQDGLFQKESVERFFSTGYQVTPQIDRMGIRLEGTALAHISPSAADIVSDGVTAGAIQVPGNGQPIILLADCQTVGGYPKIATVISADLPRLGQSRQGDTIRFEPVSVAQARQALLERDARLAAWAGGLHND
jgi:allophanate hydrolase